MKSGFDHEKLGKGTISALEMGIKPAKLGIFSRFRSSKVAKNERWVSIVDVSDLNGFWWKKREVQPLVRI